MNPAKTKEIETLIKQKLNVIESQVVPIQYHIAKLLEEPIDDPRMPHKRYSITD